jgi:hypothetical protein
MSVVELLVYCAGAYAMGALITGVYVYSYTWEHFEDITCDNPHLKTLTPTRLATVVAVYEALAWPSHLRELLG